MVSPFMGGIVEKLWGLHKAPINSSYVQYDEVMPAIYQYG